MADAAKPQKKQILVGKADSQQNKLYIWGDNNIQPVQFFF